MEEATPEQNVVRRGEILAELTQLPNILNPETPKASSADELVIQQRGPRVKPLTWSPVDCNKMNILVPPRDKTPERVVVKEMKPGLRRRLTLSPVRHAPADNFVRKRIKALTIN